MNIDNLEEFTKDLKAKYPDIDLRKIEVDEKNGKSTLYLGPTKGVEKSLASLRPNSNGIVIPKEYKNKASVFNRDPLDRSTLDLMYQDAYNLDPIELYRIATEYYHTDPIVGSVVTLLSNLACKGFENDIDDVEIKNFFDVWCFDVGMDQILEWIFLDFFKVGAVHTYKVLAAYEPRISYLSPIPGTTLDKNKTNEKSAKKRIWSKKHIPVSYTVLNPLLVKIEGNLLFDKYEVRLQLPGELNQLLNKPLSELNDAERELIKILPHELKTAAETGQELHLDSDKVGSITYMKQPYERYAKPRIARILDALNYKKCLQEADLSTLDGITNYILKITIGNDEFPVTSQEELEAAAQLFNTPSKAYEVCWNHTLNVEKIVSPEIESILGKGKYGQVVDDIMVGLSVPRALLDGEGNPAGMEFAVKGVLEEINYARRQVERWLYNEYRHICEAVGFAKFPKIRWDEGILRDTILYMTVISQLVDRRMLSYNTALETLGFDFPTELNNMKNEVGLVMDGTFGIIGSPWQNAKSGGETTDSQDQDDNIQDEQRSPKGTPSNGRPLAKPAKDRQDETDPSKTITNNLKYEKEKSFKLSDVVKDMTSDEFNKLVSELIDIRK